jgi:HSP20 family protein
MVRHGAATIVRFSALGVTHVDRLWSPETVCRLARYLPFDLGLAATRQVGSAGRSRATDPFLLTAELRKQPMTLAKRRNAFRDLEEMFDSLGRPGLSTRRDSGHEVMTTPDWAPVVDIREDESEYLIKAELPEIEKEDVRISLQQGVLVIQGERKIEREEGNKGGEFHRIERAYGSFARSFTLPEDVDAEQIDAEQKDGMLYVHLPKHRKPPSKSIEVKVKSASGSFADALKPPAG